MEGCNRAAGCGGWATACMHAYLCKLLGAYMQLPVVGEARQNVPEYLCGHTGAADATDRGACGSLVSDVMPASLCEILCTSGRQDRQGGVHSYHLGDRQASRLMMICIGSRPEQVTNLVQCSRIMAMSLSQLA